MSDSIIGGLIGGVGSLLGGAAQSSAASDAAGISAGASRYAADIQKQIYDQQRADQTPWRNTGVGALNQLAYLMGIPSSGTAGTTGAVDYNALRSQYLPQYTTAGGTYVPMPTSEVSGPNMTYVPGPSTVDEAGLQAAIQRAAAAQSNQPGTASGMPAYNAGAFGSLLKPFGMSDYQADPGYGFRLSEGLKALDRSASARGGLLSGAALKGITRFGQDTASNEFQNAFNRFQVGQGNQFNRLSSVAGLGQTATNALGQAGQNYAGNVGNITMQGAGDAGTAALLAGQSRASAYGGIGNALGRAFAPQQSQWSMPAYGGYSPYNSLTSYYFGGGEP